MATSFVSSRMGLSIEYDLVTSNDPIVDEFSKILQEEIDNEIVDSLLLHTGWTIVNKPDLVDWVESDMINWLLVNVPDTSTWKYRNYRTLFKNNIDSISFSLAWT